MAPVLQSTAFDETLDAPLAATPFSSPSVTPQRVALVEGSSPHLSSETQSLLRTRLRAAALVLFGGFLAFLLKSLAQWVFFDTPQRLDLLIAHIAMTAVAGVTAMGLCRKCAISMWKLRTAELVIFGGSALFFLLLQYTTTIDAAKLGIVEDTPLAWTLLIFIYALFVPNFWQRAAVVVGGIALVPVLTTGFIWWTHPEFSKLVAQEYYSGMFVALAMYMTLVAVIATTGVAMIGTLRKQAFAARKLGQYQLKRLIGSGGMGDVYLAEHQLMKRPCAIKVIRPEKAGDPQVLARFEREVQLTAKLSHWNTIEIFDYGRSDDGTFYYVMEYLPGLSMNDLVDRHGPLPAERVIHLLTQVCDALGEAHQKHLIHRDLKPGNIFAAQRGGVYDVVKLLDFGLVKPLAETESVGLTQDGAITGSPLYMSPEQAAGDDVADPRSDIYSLGAVAYFLLTGQPPFNNAKPLQVMIAHVHQAATPPSQVLPGIPDDLEQVILRCLAKKPEDRFQDAASLRSALEMCQAAGLWNRDLAHQWWRHHACPKKLALDAAAMQTAGMC